MPPDVRSRFAWLVKTFLLLLFIAAAVYGIALVGEMVMARAHQVSCESNLRRIGEAMFMYKNENANRLPPYLTLLNPRYLDDAAFLICPADSSKGKQGAFPRWARIDRDGKAQPPDTWHDEYAFTDLDGPTLKPWEDKDTIPCSYYYRFNDYPVDTSEEGLRKGTTSRMVMEDVLKQYRDKTPVASCFWHLPAYPKDSDGDTTNLLYDLTRITEYPKDWRLDMPKAGD